MRTQTNLEALRANLVISELMYHPGLHLWEDLEGREEDFEFIAPPTEYEDVVQANNKPSTLTDRGHQYPAAFLIRASGLDKHGCNSSQPLPYTHMDVAGSSGPFPGVPTGAPILALAHAFALTQ